MIPLRKFLLSSVALATLACNAVARTGAAQTPTATLPPPATATATETPEPALSFIPADSQGTPIVTAPADRHPSTSGYRCTDHD
jgi:hypothetical protein